MKGLEEVIEPLNRIAFKLGSIPVYWYGVIIGFGVLIGYLMATREAKKRGLPKDIIADFLLYAIPISIIGARMYYVIFRWEQFADNPLKVFAIWEGGIAIHGALIGGALTAVVYCRLKQIRIWQFLDIIAPSVLIGQAIGRWGNFVNQEVYGGEVTREFLENLLLPEFIINQMYINGAYYQPTFLYESLWNLLGVVILLLLRRVNWKQGEIFFTYVIWYSVGRFVIEGMRLDNLMIGNSLRTAQVVSIILVVGAAITWIYRRKSGLATLRYLDEEPKEKKKGGKRKKKS